MRILFVGYAVIDMIDHRHYLGGAGGSMSLNAGKLGITSSFFGPLSNESNGLWYRNQFLQSGIDISLCDVRSPAIPTCLITDPFGHGSTRKWEDHGALSHFEQMFVSAEKLATFDRIFLCNAPPKVGEMIAEKVKDRVLLYIPGPKAVSTADWIRQKILQKTEIAFANQEEAPVLWNAHPFENGVQIVVNTKGSKGGVVHLPNTIEHRYRPLRTGQVVDTTGAGDAWALGFVWEWLQSQNVRQAIQSAKKLAGKSIQIRGGLLP